MLKYSSVLLKVEEVPLKVIVILSKISKEVRLDVVEFLKEYNNLKYC